MISSLSQNISIKRSTLNANFGFGEPGATEILILSTKARIVEVKRTQAVMQQLSVQDVNYKITIRYAAGREVMKDDIIEWDGKRLKAITGASVIEIGKKKYLETIIIYQNG